MISREKNLWAGRRLSNRFVGNARGFIKAHRVWLWMLVIAAIADGASTIWFMAHDGVDAEVHPVVRLISMILGPILGPAVGKVGQFVAAIGIAIFFLRWARWILAVVVSLYLWAAWFNVWGRHLYVPRLLEWLGGQ